MADIANIIKKCLGKAWSSMNAPMRTGAAIATLGGLGNLVSNSPIGHAAYDAARASYGLEHEIDGSTQAGALAGVTLAAYGATKLGMEKAMPFTGEKTRVAAALTAATSTAYGLATSTDLVYDAVCNMGMYNHNIARALEVIATAGIGVGIVATGALFAKDLCSLAGAGAKKIIKRLED